MEGAGLAWGTAAWQRALLAAVCGRRDDAMVAFSRRMGLVGFALAASEGWIPGRRPRMAEGVSVAVVS